MIQVRKIRKGRLAEVLAVKFLQKIGYQILEKNYSTRLGEVDIIAKDDDVTVFVEVKYRQTTNFGYPQEAVTHQKIEKIISVINDYIKKQRLHGPIRIDVLSILGDIKKPQIHHLTNVTI